MSIPRGEELMGERGAAASNLVRDHAADHRVVRVHVVDEVGGKARVGDSHQVARGLCQVVFAQGPPAFQRGEELVGHVL